MNTLRTSLLALAAATLLAPAVHAAPVVSYYGYQVNMDQWRSTSATKTITLAPAFNTTITDPAGYYGTDGWTALNAFSLPTYISAQSIGASFYVPGGYGLIDNPSLAVAPTVTPQMASSLIYQIPGVGVESSSLLAFTVGNAAPASFLMGIAFGQLPSPSQDVFLGSSFRVAVGASTTAQIPLIGNDGIIDWVFFQVDNAVSGNVINIYGVGGPAGYADLAAVSFGPVPIPEPSWALMGVALFAVAALRRRYAARA